MTCPLDRGRSGERSPRDAAVRIVEKTKERLGQGFGGIKLYPPIGYHPYDRRLWLLYEWANELEAPPPILSHCSRPASVQFHGRPTRQMQTDPESGEVGHRSRADPLTWFTDPDSYKTLLQTYPRLRVCLAHFGGAGVATCRGVRAKLRVLVPALPQAGLSERA